MSLVDHKLYLTFDFDWVADEAICWTAGRLGDLGVRQATFFATHQTPVIDLLRGQGFEVGLHPNLIPLMFGETPVDQQNARSVILRLREQLPEAVSVRCHGLVHGFQLSHVIRDEGFTHESNVLIPVQSGIALKPFELPAGLVQVPFHWGDYLHYVHTPPRQRLTPDEYLQTPGLKVLNFHPIHVFLNTDCPETYRQARPATRDIGRLKELRNEREPGVLSFLEQLVESAQRMGFQFGRVADIRP